MFVYFDIKPVQQRVLYLRGRVLLRSVKRSFISHSFDLLILSFLRFSFSG